MHPYVKSIQALLVRHTHPRAAIPMKRYMRDQFEYLGIKGPELGALFKELKVIKGLPDITDLDPILRDLWDLPQREYQYAGLMLLSDFEKQLPESFTKTLEYLIVTKSWWDTVDALSSHTLGLHFKRYPGARRKYVAKWRKSDNLWLRRATLLFQLQYKRETDFELLCGLIRGNLGSKEFFINKAIGWSLRQYARTDPRAVKKFVSETPLHPLSAREALKSSK